MSPGPEDQWRPPEPPGRPPRPGQSGPLRTGNRPKWMPWLIIGLIVAVFLIWRAAPTSTPAQAKLDYGDFLTLVGQDHVSSIKYDASSGKITGEFTKGFTKDGKTDFVTQGQINQLPDADIALLNAHHVARNYKPRSSDILGTLLIYLLPLLLIGAVWFFIARRAQGQMGAVMNIGRSRAKVYNTDKPKTTFADVAGYGAVKEEITEVVGFLKQPGKFKEIGARIPKGVLLVGPPGTGKTLIARAVAGEAGVPFISITGSDFMEMFVGVGAARVRDLFQTAKKQAPAIIFVDEIDSIGRKRGAGLGGGHDEREQTLNQMLAEMDGFEATEGIVMMAATNRPDVLDPALLRPGRFDRQILVPLPTLDERIEILKVHMRDKKMSPDVDVNVVARGTPGMSGADLANLVNEAALFAVRRGANEVHREDFDAARDRVLMGLKRESLALSEEEKEIIAYHEGGHAVCAYVLEHADPLHKVTILPTGMALGVTHQLPVEERHIYKREYIADSLVVRLGGRVAEELIFGHQSTGAQNDLVGNTELARKMVREWGMSDRIGPMAWGSQGAVFLGEDLMHTRDYSDETARVIDEEVERILRDEEDRCRKVLTEYRPGLDAVAKALRERETLSGEEVAETVDQAMGRKVGGPRLVTTAEGSEVPAEPLVPSPTADLDGDIVRAASPNGENPNRESSNGGSSNGERREPAAPVEPQHGYGE
ncbi:MAG TPA: ATP-dependent zinc metalloprotease FtsH [Acidimicrobiia bacterium]|nr:ATP-dependent zinc metalloprotease FtsH [Acidimicrobiia bacterium]